MKTNFFLTCIVILFLTHPAAHAQLRLPSVISSNMVLQQNDSCALWGWAGPGEKVYVTASWSNHTDSVLTNNGARWKLKIKTPVAGGPFTVTIVSRNTIELQNVMIGEVWVCSGQSNMEMSNSWGEKDTRAELATCATNNIHFFQVPRSTSDAPQDNTSGQWVSCDSNTIKTFSAVGYFFGKRLSQQLNVPIGLINTSWGGTPAEVWTPGAAVENNDQLKTAATKIKPSQWWPNVPGQTYNAMIAPFIQFNIAGSIWYQGESNTGTNDTYTKLLTTMIDSWRAAWKKDFPFYYVQIAPYKYGENNIGALLQEAQTKAMEHPNVGMIVTTDLVDSVKNIHPSHKSQVGYRLANWALAETYKKPGIAYKSPQYKSTMVKNNSLIVSFDNAGKALQSKDKIIGGFYISGAGENWQPATVKIEKDQIILSNKDIKEPKYIRYGFGNTMLATVFSADGLPVIPFRTDNWPVDQSTIH